MLCKYIKDKVHCLGITLHFNLHTDTKVDRFKLLFKILIIDITFYLEIFLSVFYVQSLTLHKLCKLTKNEYFAVNNVIKKRIIILFQSKNETRKWYKMKKKTKR